MTKGKNWTDQQSFDVVERDCAVCQNNEFSEWANADGFTTVQCSNCGFVFINPVMVEADLDVYYSGYIEHRLDNEKKMRLRNEQYKIDAKFLRMHLESGSILDVGCSGGFFLDELGDSFERFGLERDPEAAEHAQTEFGFDVKNEQLGEDSFPDGKFDLVIMRGVIEHIPYPGRALQRVQELLRPDGFYFISATPNVESYCADFYRDKWNVYHPVEHVNLFSYTTLSRLCQQHQLEPVEVAYPYLETPYADPEADYAAIQRDVMMKQQDRWSEVDKSPAFWGNMMTAMFQKLSKTPAENPH
jgi:SAM-dependent methyltransferase